MLVLVLARAATAGPASGDDVLALAVRMVAEVGPRPAGSLAAVRAQDWVEAELALRGWTPQRSTGLDGSVWACQPGEDPRLVLFLAHTDTAHRLCPGANDNAAAVAVLLTAAEELRGQILPRRTCLAFPDAEEIGLRGSHTLAGQREERLGGPIDQVVALDMVGRGRLTHNGLGPAFGARRLRALLAAAPAEVPFVYRALSAGRPEMERSDHAAFTGLGIPSSHLMARGEGGVDLAYHTVADTPDRLDVHTLGQALAAVEGIARAAPLPEEHGGPAIVVPWVEVVLPTWLTWGIVGGGSLIGLGALKTRADEERGGWLRWIGGTLILLAVTAAAMTLAAADRPWHLARTGAVVAAGWASWGAVQAWRPFDAPARPTRVVAVVLAWLLTAATLALQVPLLAVPCAITAAAVGLGRWPALRLPCALVAAWIPVYGLRADAIRELAHHSMVPAVAWGWAAALVLLGLPLSASIVRPVRWLVPVFGAAAAIAVATAWWLPDERPPWVGAERLSPW